MIAFPQYFEAGESKMDRVSEAVKKIDELIKDATRDQRLKRTRLTALRALTIVRKVLTRSEPPKSK